MLTNVITTDGVLTSVTLNASASNTLIQDANDNDFESLRDISAKFIYDNVSISDTAGIFKSKIPIKIGDKIVIDDTVITLDNVTQTTSSFVPVLTSNTSSGTVSGNFDETNLYKLFTDTAPAILGSELSYVNYHFDIPTIVQRIILTLDSYNTHITIEGSVDGTNYTTLVNTILNNNLIVIPIAGSYSDYKITIDDAKTWNKIQLTDYQGDTSDISAVVSTTPANVYIENDVKINNASLNKLSTSVYDAGTGKFTVDTIYDDININGRILETLINFKSISSMTYFTSKVFKSTTIKT